MSPAYVCDTVVSILVVVFMFSPGLLLTLCAFPDARPLWQIAMGAGFGIVLTGLSALGLSYLPVGITRHSVHLTIIVLNAPLAAWLWTVHRRRGVKSPGVWLTFMHCSKLDWKTCLPSALMFIILSMFVVVVPSLTHVRRESYTEFYIVDAYFDVPPWRRSVDASVLFPVTVAVVSSEKSAESFMVYVTTEGETTQVIHFGVLKPGETATHPIRIPPRVSRAQRYDLLLYKGESKTPYRTLYFWLRETPDQVDIPTA
jgi:uncharacterized membrane protein